MKMTRALGVATGLLGMVAATAVAQKPKPVEYRGTIGQQKVVMTLVVDDDAVKSGSYRYESQRDAVPVREGKYYGVTVVFADDDGNVFHLHLMGGSPDGSFAKGKALEGTVNREGQPDLPVKLERVQ
jgi:hypothetical protein